jgi:hypothetical protein
MVLARKKTDLAPGALLIGVILLATGCSGSDEVSSPPNTPAPIPATTVELTVPDTTLVRPATSVAPVAPLTSEPLSTFATVPDEPVPGLDSDDPFCRAWSQFAGSFQTLALASSVGADPENAVRLEVAASGAVVGAVADLDASMPIALADEHDAFIDGLLGPFTNRARIASEALLAAGLTARQLDELGDLWLTTVAEAGSQDPDLVLVVPSGYQPPFDNAVASFSADVVAIVEDPSLVTDAAAPRTLSFIAGTCPDQGILAGNDIIGD